MSRPRSYITVVAEDRRPAVVRVRIVGECGDWRAVQPVHIRRDDCDFEITLHRRYVYGSWMEAWKRAKASARRPINFRHRAGKSAMTEWQANRDGDGQLRQKAAMSKEQLAQSRNGVSRNPLTGGKDRRAIFDFGRVPGTGLLPPGSTAAISLRSAPARLL